MCLRGLVKGSRGHLLKCRITAFRISSASSLWSIFLARVWFILYFSGQCCYSLSAHIYKSLKACICFLFIAAQTADVTPLYFWPLCFRAGVWSRQSAPHPADCCDSSSHHHNRHEIPFCFSQSVSLHRLHFKPPVLVYAEEHVKMSLFFLQTPVMRLNLQFNLTYMQT